MELSRDYLKKVSAEDISRNFVWDIKKMQWNYLFNYGKDNSIDFSKLNGLVGIFRKNYSGKSSIIDAALFITQETQDTIDRTKREKAS